MEGASSASESANESYSGDETRDEDSLGCEDQSTAMSIGEDSIDILLETAEDGPPAENTCNTVTSTVSNTAMTLHSVEYLITTAPQESDATALQESDAPIADETVEIANNDELICVKVDKINKSMEDPNAMSYRIAANLVLPDDVRQGLLDSPNAVLRLR